MNNDSYTPTYSIGDIIVLIELDGQTFDNEEDYREAINQKSALIVNISEEPFKHYEMTFPFSKTYDGAESRASIIRSCSFIDKYYRRLNNDA